MNLRNLKFAWSLPSLLALGWLIHGPACGAAIPGCGLRGVPRERPHLEIQSLAIRPGLPAADANADPTVIDVMFLYTPQAVVGAGDEETLKVKILKAVADANFAYTNSQINISINPVRVALIDYVDSGDIIGDLSSLANSVGAFASVPSLRNDYKADIVCLVMDLENVGIGGLAWDIPPLRGNASSAFLAIRRSELSNGITLAHELGHLMGCAHDREHAGDLNDPFFRSRRSYIFGYRLEIQGVTYIDMMAYEPGVVLPYFANPRIKLDDVPLGSAEGASLPSDTARTMNETSPYVAAYRQALSRVEFEVTETNVLRSAAAINLRVRRAGDLSGSTRVNVTVLPDGTATAGDDFTLATSSLTFDSGVAERTVSVQVSAAGGSRRLHLALASPTGSHGLGLKGEMILDILQLAPVVRAVPVVVRENAGFAEIVPVFTGSSGPTPPRVRWHLQAGSALPGIDYTPASGELKAALANGGVTLDPVAIAILDDQLGEPDKSLNVVFEETTYNGQTYGAVTNEVRILDDDRPGALLDAPGRDLNPDGRFSIALRADHKMLVWGGFSVLRGQSRTGIALLNADGTVDSGFTPPEFLAGHRRIERLGNALLGNVQWLPDGKLLIAGEFARANGKARGTIARLNANGTLDETFGTNLRFDGSVDSLALQPDGRIVIGGAFEQINGERRSFVARLNADGTVDRDFAPNGGPASSWTVAILSLAVQADGKIIIAGFFDQVDGVDVPNIARLNPDGTLDRSFSLKGASGPVLNVQLQPDGRIVAGGVFDSIGDFGVRKLARLNPDGSVDSSFQAPQPNAEVRHVVSLPDGRLLLDGAFTSIANTSRRFVALLRNDGSLDATFDPGTGPDERPGVIGLHADGSLYLSGSLTKVNGVSAPSVARIKLGSVPGAFTDAHETAPGKLSLRASVLPGGVYDVESSLDFKQWTPAGTAQARGFDRDLTTVITEPGPRAFLRLRDRTP